jgi:hypothetical protein
MAWHDAALTGRRGAQEPDGRSRSWNEIGAETAGPASTPALRFTMAGAREGRDRGGRSLAGRAQAGGSRRFGLAAPGPRRTIGSAAAARDSYPPYWFTHPACSSRLRQVLGHRAGCRSSSATSTDEAPYRAGSDAARGSAVRFLRRESPANPRGRSFPLRTIERSASGRPLHWPERSRLRAEHRGGPAGRSSTAAAPISRSSPAHPLTVEAVGHGPLTAPATRSASRLDVPPAGGRDRRPRGRPDWPADVAAGLWRAWTLTRQMVSPWSCVSRRAVRRGRIAATGRPTVMDAR